MNAPTNVIEHCGLRFEQDPPSDAPENASSRLVFLGDDEEEVALEVMAVELEDDALLVIHAMPLRDRYRSQYEEAKKWRSLFRGLLDGFDRASAPASEACTRSGS